MIKVKPLLEKDVKKSINRSLLDYPEIWVYMPVQSAYGKHGIPDYVACVPMEIVQEMVGKTVGVFAAIEAKRPGNVASTTQEDIHIEIRAASGVVHVINTADRAAFAAWLRAAKRAKDV